MNSPTPVVYVFYGQDEPTLKETLAELCARATDAATADLNTTRFDGREAEVGTIQSAANTLPFLAETRLIMVDGITEANPSRKVIEQLPEIFPSLPDSTRLVFVEAGVDLPDDAGRGRAQSSPRQTALKKLINAIENDPRGKVYAFKLPKDMQKWLMRRAALHNAQIEPEAAQTLAERVGDDMVLANTELAKLAAHANGRAIRASDVRALTPETPEANIFHMVDALGRRDGQAALQLLRDLLDSGDEPLMIFSMIIRQYRLLLLMREHLDQGGTVRSATDVLGVKEFVAKKLADQVRTYSLDTLERIYHYLLETDVAMKGGMPDTDLFGKPIDRLDPSLALEDLVARLAVR